MTSNNSYRQVRKINDCQLNSAHGKIQNVIEIQFDNTHFSRENPNVPSDLAQMPHLLNFIKNNDVLLANHYTPLISHIATDILTTLAKSATASCQTALADG